MGGILSDDLSIRLYPSAPFRGELNHPIITGPLLATEENRGDLEFLCSNDRCGVTLVERANKKLLAGITAIQCWNCRSWSSGNFTSS